MNIFTDRVNITVAAGNGGNGAVSFHREKYVTNGGPDGGDGGRGGDIVFVPDDHMSTLAEFRYKRKFEAKNGEDGYSRRRYGKSAEPVEIPVPRGTVIRDAATGSVIHDMSSGEKYVVARGGRGGWGNSHFATPTRQAPRFAKSGLPGERRDLTLELKLLADVGLVGLPNAGKSTLLSVISNANPKIGDYPFTTLAPGLGVVRLDGDRSFVVADIPGIIQGASGGAGLGLDFLRHVDRCRLLIHLVDVSGLSGDPIEAYETINGELNAYSESLGSRLQIVAANKIDSIDESNDDLLSAFRDYLSERGIALYEISAATRTGVAGLLDKTSALLGTLPPIAVFEPDYVEVAPPAGSDDIEIEERGGVFYLEGAWLDRLCSNVNFDDYESRMFFDRMLKKSGLYDRLLEMGIEEGGTVSINGMEFEYWS